MSDARPLLSELLAHREALVGRAAPIVGCRQRAEDVVHELFLRLASRDDHPPVSRPVAFLQRSVANLARDQARRQGLELRHARRESGLDDVHAPSAEHCSRDHEALTRVQAALAELPQDCRVAFEMHRLGGYTHREIATALGVSPSMVDKHIRRALTHCRDALRDG